MRLLRVTMRRIDGFSLESLAFQLAQKWFHDWFTRHLDTGGLQMGDGYTRVYRKLDTLPGLPLQEGQENELSKHCRSFIANLDDAADLAGEIEEAFQAVVQSAQDIVYSILLDSTEERTGFNNEGEHLRCVSSRDEFCHVLP